MDMRRTLVALLVLVIGGYLVYNRFGGSVVAAGQRAVLPLPVLLGLGVAGGIASFFSPCSIVFAPTFLMVAGSAEDSRRRVMGSAVWVALGILVFYAVLSLALGGLGAAVTRVMGYMIPVLGVAFLAMGALTLTGRTGFMDRIARLNPALGACERAAPSVPRRQASSLFSVGLLYGAGAHGCSLPIFLGIILVPLATGDVPRTVWTVLAYGVAIALSLLATVAVGRSVMPARGRLWGEAGQIAAGWLFTVIGGYELVYFALHFAALTA